MSTERTYLQSTRHDGYQHLEIDYPEKKNAMSPAFFSQLRDAVAAAERDPRVRVLLLSGRGELFCGGADLDIFKNNPFADGFSVSPIHHCMVEMFRCEKPIVAAVHGAAPPCC